jgi:diacylglycerol kinase family enzyme
MKVAALYGPRALTDDARPFQFGQHLRLPEIEYFKFRHIRVETPTPTEIYADGDFRLPYVCRNQCRSRRVCA